MEDRDRGRETAVVEDLKAQDAELKHRTGGKVAVCVCTKGHAVCIEVRTI